MQGRDQTADDPRAETQAADLAALSAEFPGFDISREASYDRVRYVARRRHPDTNPAVVVTADRAELCQALGG